MLPAVTVAVGNATELRITPSLPPETVTVKGTPGRAGVPSPISTVAVPLKVALPSAATDPLLTSPSTAMFCGVPRSEVPWSTAWNCPIAEPSGAMNIPCPSVKPFRGTPLKAAPLGKAASVAPVTPAADCAAAGAGARRLANPRIAVDRNPSRVIVSPSAATLLVDHDVPADNCARATLVDVRAELVGVCDLEHVIALARIPMVLDVRLEAARRAARAAGARELCRGGGEHRHQGDRAIEVCPRDMVQVIQMAATSHSSLVFCVEAEGALATRDGDLDL